MTRLLITAAAGLLLGIAVGRGIRFADQDRRLADAMLAGAAKERRRVNQARRDYERERMAAGPG